VVEGVETPRHLNRLRELSCDKGQGLPVLPSPPRRHRRKRRRRRLISRDGPHGCDEFAYGQVALRLTARSGAFLAGAQDVCRRHRDCAEFVEQIDEEVRKE
jgi:hypothetical protein